MKLNDYQTAAVTTAIYPEQRSFQGLVYCALKLAGEAGEVADKVGKIIRDDESILSLGSKDKLMYELGDVLWYVANTARELGTTLEIIASMNISKLQARKENDTLHGDGDVR